MGLFPSLTVGTNSYVTVDEIDSYVSDERNPNFYPSSTAWDDLTTGQKTVACLMAAQHIDQCNFAGSKYESDQALEWPREATDMSGFYDLYSELDYVDTDTVWQIKVAQAEEAIAIADRQNWNIQRNIKREKSGNMEIEKNPDVILLSHVAYTILLDSGWLCTSAAEIG